MTFNSEQFREYMKYKQYQLSDRDQFIASLYGDKLTYNEIVELRLLALREILIKYKVEVITDISCGKGLLEYRNKWEMMMKEVINERVGKGD